MPFRSVGLINRWVLAPVLVGFATFVGLPRLAAQPAKEPNVQQPVERSKLETKHKDLSALIKDLTGGKADPKENAEAVVVLAQWHMFQVTWADIQTTPGAMTRVHADLESFLEEANKNKATALLEAFTAQAVESLKLVLQNDRGIARVNGARMLARLAKAGQESTADLLADSIADPQQNDAVKYYAFMGLRELFAQANQANPSIFQGQTGKAREKRCLEVLVKAASRNVPGAEILPVEEREGIRVVRREALHALAMNRRPAIADDKGVLVLRPAQVLAQAALDVGMIPGTRPDERVEAAIGLARQSPKAFDGYQADYGAYLLGQFTADLAGAVSSKVAAARLIEAFESMKAESAALKEGKYIGEVLDQSIAILKTIERTGKGEGKDLAFWLGDHPPANGTLYKGVDDSTVKKGESKEPMEKPTKPEKKPEEKKPGNK